MNANRMTLTKTRKRLAMARRGHVLMKHKLEELIHLFQAEVGRYGAAQEDVARLLREVYVYHALDGAPAAAGPRLHTTVRVETGHLLNLKVPVVAGTVVMEAPPYGLLETSAERDRSTLRLQEAIPLLLRLAQVQRRIELLLHEIEVTRPIVTPDIDTGAVRSWLQGRLAAFKQPKAVRHVDELPRNAMGKVQKNALRQRFDDVLVGRGAHVSDSVLGAGVHVGARSRLGLGAVAVLQVCGNGQIDGLDDRPGGHVIGAHCSSGQERLGTDVEGVLSIDNGALRIAPLVEAGFGRAVLAYGPFSTRPGLAFAVYMLNGHNTAQAEPLPDTFFERLGWWLRGPHVDKKSRQQFEIRTHKRLIDIIEPTAQTVDELKKLNLPSGVDITINV